MLSVMTLLMMMLLCGGMITASEAARTAGFPHPRGEPNPQPTDADSPLIRVPLSRRGGESQSVFTMLGLQNRFSGPTPSAEILSDFLDAQYYGEALRRIARLLLACAWSIRSSMAKRVYL